MIPDEHDSGAPESDVAAYDLVVIGAGAAGMGAAWAAVRRRARVAMVEDGPVGDDCTFVGCVPSKTLIESR